MFCHFRVSSWSFGYQISTIEMVARDYVRLPTVALLRGICLIITHHFRWIIHTAETRQMLR